jgi:hypothetical protein
MTNTTAHANCTHPTTKTDRARCRRMNGGATPKGLTVKPAGHRERHVVEPCSCKGKPSGFRDAGNGMWVCADCDRPTKGFLLNALGQVLTAA